MNEVVNTIILITVILVLILAYVLLSYFYNNYDENKQIVNSNFKKTATHINETNTTINNNITALDNKATGIDNKYNLVTITTNSNLNNLSSNFNSYKSTTDPLLTSFNSNLINFDNNLKYYANFKDNNVSINDKLYSYKFGVTPNLSLELLRNIDVISGMTVRTNNDKLFRVCDSGNATHCVDLNVNNGNFNIYPSPLNNNGINNLNIMTSNKDKVLANFNFNQKSIYLGGAGEDAGLFINESNVYVKNLNLMKNGANYSDPKSLFDVNTPSSTFNTFKYDVNRLTTVNKVIIGNYTINATTKDGTTTTQLDIFLKSKFQIPEGTQISIEIYEIKTPPAGVILNNKLPSSPLGSLTLTGKILTGTITSSILPNITTHFRNDSSDIAIDSFFNGTNYSRAFISEF